MGLGGRLRTLGDSAVTAGREGWVSGSRRGHSARCFLKRLAAAWAKRDQESCFAARGTRARPQRGRVWLGRARPCVCLRLDGILVQMKLLLMLFKL